MTNEFVLKTANQLEGFKTRNKELHFSSFSMSLHNLVDDFSEALDEFEDAYLELCQVTWGFIKPGDLSPILPEAMEFEEMLTEVRGMLVKIKKEFESDMLNSGIINRVDDMFEQVNIFIYRTRICKHQAAKND